MTRKEAVQTGAKIYNTGRPCRHGHTEGRYASTGTCVGCMRMYRLEQQGGLVRVTLFLHPKDAETVKRTADMLQRSRGGGA